MFAQLAPCRVAQVACLQATCVALPEEVEPYLSVVKSYCGLRNPTQIVAQRFRSHELEEMACRAFPESCHSHFSRAMSDQFNDIHAKREEIISNQKAHSPTRLDEGGRLLLVNWRESLFDGACAPITDGFLDDDCMPGWDTWVRVVSLDESQVIHGLVCWIPSELVPAVNDALLIDAAQCMSWLRQDSGGNLNAVG